MDLKQILKNVRKGLADEVGSDAQRQWSDFELINDYANDVVREIIKELLCLTADDDFTETPATGTITLSGTAGQISSVTVNGVVVTSGAVPFTTDLPTTAAALASNINAFSSNPANTNPVLFTAQAAGSVVTISGPSGSGSTPNGYAITPIVSGGLSFVSTTMSGGACLCKIFVVPGQAKYQIHSKILQITRFKPGLRSKPIDPVTKQQADANFPGWQDSSLGLPSAYIPDYNNKKITLVVAPADPDTIVLDVVRFPYTDFDVETLSAVPEIPTEYHDIIIPGIKWKAFLKDDAETLDMARAEKFEKEFYRKIEQAKEKLDINRRPTVQGVSHAGMY